jgi:hypothetical protein
MVGAADCFRFPVMLSYVWCVICRSRLIAAATMIRWEEAIGNGGMGCVLRFCFHLSSAVSICFVPHLLHMSALFIQALV